MKQIEYTLMEALEQVNNFSPIKIILNGIVLYNDYDCDTQLDDGTWGENTGPLEVIPKRLWLYDRYLIESIKIEIVEYHHSIVYLKGRYVSPPRED